MSTQELLSIGYPITMTQNVVYAVPARNCRLFCQTTTATIIMSNIVAMTTTAPVTLTDGRAEVNGGFIKCTSGDVVIKLSVV